jgi:polyisoprenyl-teichoic acid--peptidoglycan teichoic acid transferase
MLPAYNKLKLALPRLKRKLLQHVWVARILIVVSVIVLLWGFVLIFATPLKILAGKIAVGPRVVTTFFTDPLYTLPSYDGYTNIIFLGMGGEDHDGATLTDTIIFISLDLKNTATTMLSIPRDIWVSSINAKINAAYAFGESKEEGGGYLLVEDAVYEIVGQPIHYIVSLDFDSFTDFIDLIGGIEVVVDRSFTDEWYPIKGREEDLCGGDLEYRCRYQTVSFSRGKQFMDGKTALKFSRSRHAEGEEGTDFARSERQQKVIKAIKDKIISSNILLNPKKMFEFKGLASRHIHLDEDLSDKEYAAFAGFAFSFWRSGKEIKTLMLETGTIDNPGFLVNPPTEKYNQWVLEPRYNSWEDFQAFLKIKLKEDL